MGDLINQIKSLLKGAAGYAGVRLIDPIEVYYLPQENTFYPIISKSGCTSIKVMLIRKYNPDYENTFPGIHQVNPAKVSDNAIERLYFPTQRSFEKWTKDKKMVFVMRDPLSRLFSCYQDVVSGKNKMYRFPSGLDWAYKYTTNMEFDDFLTKVCSTADLYSDRHFRSQSFYLSDAVKNGLESLEAITLKEYMSRASTKNASDENESLQLNINKSAISDELKAKLLQSQKFKRRFKADLLLFERLRKNGV
ncbi:sulfotransferase family protein [Cryomorpha ignava]|uniref:Sulfotransferase family protein n=1 Tax=Cryomorpha ignava TaxID=101383 RepID=A0A7K3WL66_9FLAO|nr:sulfotransferase family 2 domain-containing protein [Cryomorpha ignava]NEN22234.1 sulfotransferase family protein [Cryomorpha ignava]